ncbi:cupin-like domain-containing protein [Sphingomonas sp. HHU CXW]|uniref:Cupin-like domain-containing protein n=1 Tax=Sphingomonas hominis TaxID=2741495 RepID=A0ABX2JR76_9SPHN|nr:cupin-like domain-containing protein [Sphingomonas hominis]
MTIRAPDGDALRDPQRFRTEVMERGEPALLRGAASGWAMLHDASDGRAAEDAGSTALAGVLDVLRAFDAGREAEVFVGPPAIDARYHYDATLTGFNFERVSLRFGEALDRIVATADVPGRPSMYMGSLTTETYLPGIEQAMILPFVPAAVRPRVWIGHSSVVACHYDVMDNVACVGAGRRRFTLYPPDAIADLYVGPIDRTLAGQPISLAASSAPGDPRYPRFERARAIVVELSPGDAIYVPKLWWHQVEALDPVNVLVNYWWDGFAAGPDQPYTTMLLAMLAIAERPAAERQAWRAWFDHYVFRPDGHPLGFLPPEQHGVLEDSSPANRSRLRAIVMRLLRSTG